MDRHGAGKLLERLGMKEKHPDMQVSFRKLATHWATLTQLITLLYSLWILSNSIWIEKS